MTRWVEYPDAWQQIYTDAEAILDDIALRIATEADPPVDTGFLQGSVYIYSERVNMFDQTWPSDYYHSRRLGGLAERQRADGPEPYSDNCVIIGWAAVYAWHVEDNTPFIYPALLSVAGGKG